VTDQAFKVKLYVSFAIVYVAWGSTFLAIRLGVQDLPPLLFAAGRSFLAGALLLAIALYRREQMPATRREWLVVCLFGLVMISLSNGASTYALKYLPSNEVALLNSKPRALAGGLRGARPKGQSLHARSMLGLLLGFAGVALLVVREGITFDAHFGWQMLSVGGCMVWAGQRSSSANMTTLTTGPTAFNALLMWFGVSVCSVAGSSPATCRSGTGPAWAVGDALPGGRRFGVDLYGLWLAGQETCARTASRRSRTSTPRSRRSWAG